MPSRRLIIYPQGGGASPTPPPYNPATDIGRYRRQARVYSESSVIVTRNVRNALSNTSNIVPPSSGFKFFGGAQGMSSQVYTRLGNIDAQGNPAGPGKAGEIALLRAGPAVGAVYQPVYFQRALINSGTFDGSTAGGGFDADYVATTGYVSGSRESAVYNAPRLFWPYIFQEDYFSPDPGTRAVADYILNNPSLGPVGPDGVHYGYWTATGSAGSGTGSTATAYRAAVAALYANLFTQMASHVLPDGWTVNESPYVAAVNLYLETAAWIPQGATDSSYSNAGMQAGLNTIHATARASFTRTMVTANLNYLADDFEVATGVGNAASRRMGFGGPDVFGFSSGQNKGTGLTALTPGQCGFTGLAPTGPNNASWGAGGTDYRGILPYLAVVQNTELIASYGHYYTPQDIFKQANETLHASMIAWQYVDHSNPDALDTAKWLGSAASIGAWNPATSGGVLACMYNNPLTHIAYPSGYT